MTNPNELSSQPQPLTPKMNSFFRKHLAWVLTLFLTCVFWLHTCNLNKKLDEKDNTISQIDLDRQSLRTLTDRQGRQIAEQDVLITNSRSALNRLTDTIFNLRSRDAHNLETIAYYKGITKVDVRNVPVPYLDSVRMRKFQDSVSFTRTELINFINDSTLQVPTRAGIQTPNIDLALTIAKDKLTLDSLTLPDTLQLRFVETPGNLFRRQKVEVQYFHSNPYVKAVGSNSAFYQPKRKSFFTRVILPVAIGVGAGILISK